MISVLLEAEKERSFENKALRLNDKISLTDLTSFDDLNFNCSKIINISILEIRAKKKIIFNSSKFQLQKVKIISNNGYFSILLFNFKGFYLTQNPFALLRQKSEIYLKTDDSYLNFMLKNISFNNYCDPKLMDNYYWSNFSLQTYMTWIKFYSDQYSDKICPLIFRNADINSLKIDGISSCLIYKNELFILEIN